MSYYYNNTDFKILNLLGKKSLNVLNKIIYKRHYLVLFNNNFAKDKIYLSRVKVFPIYCICIRTSNFHEPSLLIFYL